MKSRSRPEYARGSARKAKKAAKAMFHNGRITEEEKGSLDKETILAMVEEYEKSGSSARKNNSCGSIVLLCLG